MESICTTTPVTYNQRKQNIQYSSSYNVDFWKEVKRRWMVLGVLTVVALAVLAPNFGAPGGTIRSEYLINLPLSYIYYNAGRTRVNISRARLYTLTALHANVGALAICAVTVNAMSTTLDRRVIEGAILASVGRPCAWLSISLRSDNTIPALAAVNYAVSMVLSPIAHLLLCGRVPTLSPSVILLTSLTTVLPFALGTLSPKSETETTPTKLSALLLLYSECCALLREAEGSLYVTDVLATLFLAVCWVFAVAVSGALYARGGLLSDAEARSLLLVATPKATHIGWVVCTPAGLARLPAVFIAPAQALLLAVLAGEGGRPGEGAGDGGRGAAHTQHCRIVVPLLQPIPREMMVTS